MRRPSNEILATRWELVYLEILCSDLLPCKPARVEPLDRCRRREHRVELHVHMAGALGGDTAVVDRAVLAALFLDVLLEIAEKILVVRLVSTIRVEHILEDHRNRGLGGGGLEALEERGGAAAADHVEHARIERGAAQNGRAEPDAHGRDDAREHRRQLLHRLDEDVLPRELEAVDGRLGRASKHEKPHGRLNRSVMGGKTGASVQWGLRICFCFFFAWHVGVERAEQGTLQEAL